MGGAVARAVARAVGAAAADALESVLTFIRRPVAPPHGRDFAQEPGTFNAVPPALPPRARRASKTAAEGGVQPAPAAARATPAKTA